jgi:hypothetical protein
MARWILARYAAGLLLAMGLGSAITVAALHPAAPMAGQAPAARPVPTTWGARLPLPPSARTAAPSQAGLLTAYVRTSLTLQVLRLEQALLTVNGAVLDGCPMTHAPGTTLVSCATAALLAGGPKLARTLTLEAAVVGDVGRTLAMADPPLLERPQAVDLALVREDLMLCSSGLSTLLSESAAALPAASAGPSALAELHYGLRTLQVVALLSRAEAWLGTLDRATGATVRLPGFEPGAPSLMSQLAIE